MGLDHPHTKAGVGEFGVAISGGVWVAIRDQSVEFAKEAIDRYIKDRNNHYAENPKRAGKKIWGKERTKATFDPANNCKDPAYR